MLHCIQLCATLPMDKSVHIDYNNINSNLRILSWRSPMIPTMKNYNNHIFMHRKEEPIWNLEAGWMADTRSCVSLEKGVKAVCIWHFMRNCFDFMQ